MILTRCSVSVGTKTNNQVGFAMTKIILNTIERLHIIEGVLGNYNYHLSVTGRNGQPSLCGSTEVMSTQIPLTRWNSARGHLHSAYCKRCTEIAIQQGFNVNAAGPDTLTFLAHK